MMIKPILFNTEMVRAILDGRKTCTRRIVKPQWEECPACKYVHNEYIYDKLAENVYCARCGYPLEPESGKTAFLTLAEAEAKLKEMGKNHEF